MQPFGVVHGGVFSSLIDAAGFWAVYSQANEEGRIPCRRFCIFLPKHRAGRRYQIPLTNRFHVAAL